MAKAYSLASWNVEHFRNPDSRVDRVVDFLVDLGPPDVFALYEVEGKEVFDALVSKMPYEAEEGRTIALVVYVSEA